MAIHSIGKQRESLNFNTEEYKALIRKYLDCMGYSQLTDSFVEGHLGDMIFINPNISIERKTYVEAKSTSISLSDNDFSKEILGYLAGWLNLPDNMRFTLFIFTKKIASKKDMDKVFGAKYSVNAVKNWLSKSKKLVPEDTKEIINKAKQKDIVAFISHVEIYEADIDRLTAAIEEKNRHSNLSLESYAKSLLLDVKRRGKPIRDKNTLLSNLVLMDIPKEYYVAKVKYKKKQKIYDYFNAKKIEIPPFSFYPEKQTISTFDKLSGTNPLLEIVEGNPKTVDITEDISEKFVIGLINQHLRRIFWKKDLRRITDSTANKENIYIFECNKVNDRFVVRECQTRQGKKKEVTIPEYKTEEGKEVLNFIFHHGVEVFPRKIWDKYYVVIIPRREYSLDGFTPISGELKDVIDRKFRTPLYNRSSNILSEIRFWHYHLFVSKYLNAQKENWFDLFKFGDLENIQFDWRPKSVPKGQSLLEEFENGEYPD